MSNKPMTLVDRLRKLLDRLRKLPPELENRILNTLSLKDFLLLHIRTGGLYADIAPFS